MKFWKGEKIRICFFIVMICICLLVPVLVVWNTAKKQALIYGNTYYSVLPMMCRQLEECKGNKIVVIGNSAVAFGVDSLLLEELLKKEGYDYSVCNFGLYGAIGTRAMLDLSEEYIAEGDIVLFMPEAILQSQSLYFSANELWYALEGKEELVWNLESELTTEMLANYVLFTSKRQEQTEEVLVSGIYAKSSFDANLDLKNYERPFNEMEDGVDSNNLISLDKVCPTEEYFAYVNAYYRRICEKGAQMYFAYGPMNQEALTGDKNAYCSRLGEGYEFSIIGGFESGVMESCWFYDSNFHLNASGMTVYTVRLFDMLKTHWGDTTVTEYSLPAMPLKSEETEKQEILYGDNTDADCFAYEENGNGYRIIGVNEKGKQKSQLTIPAFYQEKKVNGIKAETFEETALLRRIIVQENLQTLPDYLFSKCTGLREIVLRHTSPQDISVGYHLLAGTTAYISVPKSAKSAFENNYFWGYYAEKMVGYE